MTPLQIHNIAIWSMIIFLVSLICIHYRTKYGESVKHRTRVIKHLLILYNTVWYSHRQGKCHRKFVSDWFLRDLMCLLQYYQDIYMNYNAEYRIRRVSNDGIGIIPCFLLFKPFRTKVERMIFTRKHCWSEITSSFVVKLQTEEKWCLYNCPLFTGPNVFCITSSPSFCQFIQNSP